MATVPIEYEPFSSEHWEDPYPVYAQLREHDPVHWAPNHQAWCVSRHADAVHVLRTPELFSSSAMAAELFDMRLRLRHVPRLMRSLWKTGRTFPRSQQARSRSLISSDPPRHDAMRNIVNRGFTPRRIQAWEGRLRDIKPATYSPGFLRKTVAPMTRLASASILCSSRTFSSQRSSYQHVGGTNQSGNSSAPFRVGFVSSRTA